MYQNWVHHHALAGPGHTGQCQLVSWSLTSLFSTNMAVSETNGHSLQRTLSSPLYSCPGLSPWSPCVQELFEIILFQQADAPGPRLESILGHCERHALLHMAPKWFDHWTTWAGYTAQYVSSLHVCQSVTLYQSPSPNNKYWDSLYSRIFCHLIVPLYPQDTQLANKWTSQCVYLQFAKHSSLFFTKLSRIVRSKLKISNLSLMVLTLAGNASSFSSSPKRVQSIATSVSVCLSVGSHAFLKSDMS